MKNFLKLLIITLIVILSVFALMKSSSKVHSKGMGTSMKISSPAFEHNGKIPSKYTCDGANVSPPLTFEGVPQNAASLVLIADDPDAPAGTWVHWVMYNILATTGRLQENIRPDAEFAFQGMNDFGRVGFGGPCPPNGTHRYFFKLYAVTRKLDLKPGATKQQVEAAMKGHILEQSEIIGLYKRN
jgi:Raf kinase inhibitor-like YbhB/YbcL family protein